MKTAPAKQVPANPTPTKIGIFDLAAIRGVALDPEVLKRTESGGIVTEWVRFTSVPGVRVMTILTYPSGAKHLPGVLFARRFGAETRAVDAKAGFVGISVAPPIGNDDPRRMDSVGGPKYSIQASYRQLFSTDPNQSYIYHHVVALVRALDYLETRPEVNLAKTTVMGQEWTGMIVALLHALDNRPAAYFVWQGAGFYADEQGNSGDVPARISRQAYEMYSPAAYAEYGKKPIYLANPLNSDLSQFDSVFELTRHLRSAKVLSFAPNRQEVETANGEFEGAGAWQTYFLTHLGGAPKIWDGTISVVNGHIRYSCMAAGQTSAYLLVSYGKRGDWTGRTWHRFLLHHDRAALVANIPVYDPKTPFYVIGQISNKAFGARGNVPQYVEPLKIGVTHADSVYPHQVFAGISADELYVSTSGKDAQYGLPGPSSGIAAGPATAATLPVYWDGMIRIMDIEPAMWTGHPTELHIVLKGDGKSSVEPLNVYFAYESKNSVDQDQQNYSTWTLVRSGQRFAPEWHDFVVPLAKIQSLGQVDSLFFQTGLKPLQIAGIFWR